MSCSKDAQLQFQHKTCEGEQLAQQMHILMEGKQILKTVLKISGALYSFHTKKINGWKLGLSNLQSYWRNILKVHETVKNVGHYHTS